MREGASSRTLEEEAILDDIVKTLRPKTHAERETRGRCSEATR
jgi:hypothetical protein